ncbi:MAG TPA: ATP-binding protein [Dehalococcoidia bacterium]|nr:ATP-binding protein [Dehalococcoidia bacterium]
MKETIGREAVLQMANQYKSVADALMELIDNPFDYRRGRALTVEVRIDKKRDEIIVLDYGGEGMDDSGLADWISWGTGRQHEATDIGQYHVGGKLAAIYLANSIEIICRRSGDSTIWRFCDPEWGTRTTLLTAMPTRANPSELPTDVLRLPSACGFTMVRLSRLKPHRYELAVLTGRLANTYRKLLAEEACRIFVNGEAVSPLVIPISSVYKPIEIPPQKLALGVKVRGRIWVTDRDRFKVGRGVNPKAGVRTVFNGRLITDGEEFGHYLAGRGTLQRIFGEIEISGLRPNTTKDGWDTSSPGWQAIHDFMHEQMQPVVAFLNQLAESKAVSRDQRKRANRIAREVARILEDLLSGRGQGDSSDQASPMGRKPPTPSGDEPKPGLGGTHAPPQPKTEAPEGAVGKLPRLSPSRVPTIEFDSLGQPDRYQLRQRPYALVINVDYPLYQTIGETDAYLAETIAMALLEEEWGSRPATDLLNELNRAIWQWQENREE